MRLPDLVCSLLLTALLILFLFHYVCFDQNFYWQQFHKRVNLYPESTFWAWHQHISSYCEGSAEMLPGVFTDGEYQTIQSLKSLNIRLTQLRYSLCIAVAISFLFCSYRSLRKRRFFANILSWSAIFGWIFFIVLLLAQARDFKFPLGNYSDAGLFLVRMYPDTLFKDLLVHFINVGLSVFSALLLVAVPLLIRREEPRTSKV